MKNMYIMVSDLEVTSKKLCRNKDIISVDELIYLLEQRIDELELQLQPDEEDVMDKIKAQKEEEYIKTLED